MSRVVLITRRLTYSLLFLISSICHRSLLTLWWLWRWCPPLPIPNREVKPISADDTWVIPGKVCRRRLYYKTQNPDLNSRGFLFYSFLASCGSSESLQLTPHRIHLFLSSVFRIVSRTQGLYK